MVDEKVTLNAQGDQLSSLSGLNILTYNKNGRPPTIEEWNLLDQKFSVINSYLDNDLKTKYRIKELGTFFGTVPLMFLVFSTLSTVFLLIIINNIKETGWLRDLSLISLYILWTMSQGGLGACAFIGTRLIARTVSSEMYSSSAAGNRPLNEDSQSGVEHVDLTDKNYLKMRIVLGSLFAFLLCFPISILSIISLNQYFIYNDDELKAAVNFEAIKNDFLMITIPFIVGFSTSLVLTVLSRFISAIQAIFGAPVNDSPK